MRGQGPEGNLRSTAWGKAEALIPVGLGVSGPLLPRQNAWAKAPGCMGTSTCALSNPCPQVLSFWDPSVTSACPSQAHLTHVWVRAEPGLARQSQVPQHVTLKPHLSIPPKIPKKHQETQGHQGVLIPWEPSISGWVSAALTVSPQLPCL